uniref:Uncharacterized protein n=1 Tax=Aegilops tauschii TaxID=37682 RepID=N1QSZ8_AEGTA
MAAAFASTPAVMWSARPERVAVARRCVVARASATMAAPAALAAGKTHYDVLGLGAGASRGEIKAAYRRLAREVHPDAVGGGGDDGFDPAAHSLRHAHRPRLERARHGAGGKFLATIL